MPGMFAPFVDVDLTDCLCRTGFFAAASFMSFQQATFNFGRRPFSFPPNGINFKTFNDNCSLNEEEKLILPKQIKMLQLHSFSLKEDSCTLCFDGTSSIELLPCKHKGFCEKCSLQLINCPLCRSEISERKTLKPATDESLPA